MANLLIFWLGMILLTIQEGKKKSINSIKSHQLKKINLVRSITNTNVHTVAKINPCYINHPFPNKQQQQQQKKTPTKTPLLTSLKQKNLSQNKNKRFTFFPHTRMHKHICACTHTHMYMHTHTHTDNPHLTAWCPNPNKNNVCLKIKLPEWAFLTSSHFGKCVRTSHISLYWTQYWICSNLAYFSIRCYLFLYQSTRH